MLGAPSSPTVSRAGPVFQIVQQAPDVKSLRIQASPDQAEQAAAAFPSPSKPSKGLRTPPPPQSAGGLEIPLALPSQGPEAPSTAHHEALQATSVPDSSQTDPEQEADHSRPLKTAGGPGAPPKTPQAPKSERPLLEPPEVKGSRRPPPKTTTPETSEASGQSPPPKPPKTPAVLGAGQMKHRLQPLQAASN